MIVSADVETYTKNPEGQYEPILDATGKHFILGCVYKGGTNAKRFTDKDEMWNYLIELGKKEQKRGKILRVYFHNARYDFYNICNLKDKNIKWFCENPFITSYYNECEKEFENKKKLEGWKTYARMNHINYREVGLKVFYKKEIIKFLDTFAIYRGSLKNMAKVIGQEKMEMPIDIGRKLTKRVLDEMYTYCKNDCKITYDFIKYLKEKLLECGVNIRNLCTINQIAISYIINQLKKEKSEHILVQIDGKASEYVYRPKYPEEIHQAYRGGLTRVFKLGCFKKASAIDCNSLYPYAITQIKFPDLRTEKKVINPLSVYTKEKLLDKVGISKVMLYNKDNEIGLIPIRTGDKSYVPTKGKYIIGVYTNLEIKEAVKEGYKLLDVEWSVIYNKGENVLAKIYKEIYKKRKKFGTDFDSFFYKSIMNSSLGKFGQRRVNQEIFIDSIKEMENYKKKNIEIIRGIEKSTDVMYKKIYNKTMKKYYCPIIPALVTAYSRVFMHREFKKTGINNLIYSDTDSITMLKNEINKYQIGEELGEFKIEKDIETNEKLIDAPTIIYGAKSKSIGNNINVSGAFKSDLNMDLFKEGKVFTKRQIGIKTNREEEIGKFTVEMRDLKKQMEETKKIEEELNKEMIYIDAEVKDVKFFKKEINKILKELM